VAEERGKHRGSDGSELHDGSDNNNGQRFGIRRGCHKHGGDGDEQRSDADGDGSSGGAGDHHAADEPDGDSRADGYVHSGSNGYHPTELSVEQEQRACVRCDFLELHHAGRDKR
jgi:hypothetical protein